MKNVLLVLAVWMLAGCSVSFPFMDGTYRETPAYKIYDISIRFSTEQEISDYCNQSEYPRGVTIDACVDMWRVGDRIESVIYIPPPMSPFDVWWAETLIHEIWHPIFNWQH